MFNLFQNLFKKENETTPVKKKIVFFTGAGISSESGLHTYRDKDGLWNNHSVNEVATIQALEKDLNKVNNFFNEIRRQVLISKPNKAHQFIKKMETNFEVSVITQNIDNLHEEADSTNVIHLHGFILKSRPLTNSVISYEQLNDIHPDDLCILTGSRLRPSVVLFGEQPLEYVEAIEKVNEADIIVVIGSSLKVNPAAMLVTANFGKKPVYILDPNVNLLKDISAPVFDNLIHIQKNATEGLEELENLLLN